MNVKSWIDCVKMESLLLNKCLIKSFSLEWQNFSLLFDAIDFKKYFISYVIFSLQDMSSLLFIQWKPLNTSSVNATNGLLHPNCLARNFSNPFPL